jgi:hypothetical protein
MARTKTDTTTQTVDPTKQDTTAKDTQEQNTDDTQTEKTDDTQKKKTVKANEIERPQSSAMVDKLMRLYPQYKKIWITPNGFVHPEGVPDYLTKGATLYENKYYKQ